MKKSNIFSFVRKTLSEFQKPKPADQNRQIIWRLQLVPPVRIIGGVHIRRFEINVTRCTRAPDQRDKQALGARQAPPDAQQHDSRQHQDCRPDRNALITSQNDHQRGKNVTNHNQGAPGRPVISADLRQVLTTGRTSRQTPEIPFQSRPNTTCRTATGQPAPVAPVIMTRQCSKSVNMFC